MAGKENVFMDGLVEKLRAYAKGLLENPTHNYASEESRKSWIFGAIDFNLDAGLIDADTCNALLKEFDLT